MSCITGDETGVVKIWNIRNSSAATLSLSFGTQSRANGITALCWRDRTTQEIIINRKNGIIEVLNINNKMLTCKKALGRDAVAAVASGLAVVRGKIIIIQSDGRIRFTAVDVSSPRDIPIGTPEDEIGIDSELLLFNNKNNNNNNNNNKNLKNNKNSGKKSKEEEEEEDGLITPTIPQSHPGDLNNNNNNNNIISPIINNSMISEDLTSYIYGRSPIEATHIHRRLALAAIGGKDNDMCIYDLASERQEPIFQAKNIRDHVLDIPMPIYITGTCIVSSSIFCSITAYHEVRFYDRRAGNRPVQEFQINREIERRPTTLMQWNCNKYLIGEASGDVHLYDTRRGFVSRAKLKGGVGSTRQMVKHPNGHQLLAVTGLDRKARIFHVPTGKLLQSIYLKQRATSILLDTNLPFCDKTALFCGVTSSRARKAVEGLGDELWDDMDPVIDDFEEKVVVGENNNNINNNNNNNINNNNNEEEGEGKVSPLRLRGKSGRFVKRDRDE